MKKRTKRIFISLLTLLVAGMAATHAYIFDVENWQPFGVLNLTKLILKPNTTQTGIILDGENYIIKIDPNNDIPDGGQIRVYEICDENGNNCKKISNLNGEGNGQCYDGISAGGITGEYCYLLQDGNLWCDNSGLPTDSSPYILPVAGNILGGIMLGYETDNNQRKYAVELDALNRAYVSVPRAGGNGDTIISGAQILNGTNGYLCTKQDDNLVCNINPSSLGNGGDGAQILEGKENFICTQSGGKNLVCNINPNNLGNGGGISAGGTPGYICRFMEDGNLKCDINPNELGGGTPIKGEHGKRCKYMCETLIIDGKDPIILDKYSNEEIDTIIANAREGSDVSREGCRVECYEDDPNGGGGGGGDGFRFGNLIGTKPTIYPVGKNYNVRIGGNTQTTYKLFVNGSTAVEPDNDVTLYKNLPDFVVDTNGIRMFGGFNFYKTATDQRRIRGLSVRGPILAGNSDSHIYMFADASGSNDEHRHFEIMGNNELAVGTQNGAFIYFAQKTGTYATFVGDRTSQSNRIGEWQSQLHVHPTLPDDTYKSYMVGINTNNPNATLDINGSIKIGNYCAPTTGCNKNTAGTIIYYETLDATTQAPNGSKIMICRRDGQGDSAYHRYNLISGGKEEDSNGKPSGYVRSCEGPTPVSHDLDMAEASALEQNQL